LAVGTDIVGNQSEVVMPQMEVQGVERVAIQVMIFNQESKEMVQQGKGTMED
jgi:hypothetical protein